MFQMKSNHIWDFGKSIFYLILMLFWVNYFQSFLILQDVEKCELRDVLLGLDM